MAVKKGLGKGLDSLITNKREEEKINQSEVENVSRETLVKLTQIEPRKGQPRKNFNEDALQELADSIKQHGVIEPLIVQKSGSMYEIIAGYFRRESGEN